MWKNLALRLRNPRYIYTVHVVISESNIHHLPLIGCNLLINLNCWSFCQNTPANETEKTCQTSTCEEVGVFKMEHLL